MMNKQEIIEYSINALLRAGADKATGILGYSEKHELNAHAGTMDLFRTTYNIGLNLACIIAQKKGSMVINKVDAKGIDEAAKGVVAMAQSSQPDEANDIAETQPHNSFSHGPEKPDRQLMFSRLQEFLAYSAKAYPKTIIEEVNFSFTKRHSILANSNDVLMSSMHGMYDFSVMFTSKDGVNTSSFNYTYFQDTHLDKPLHQCGSVDRLLRQSAEQIHTHPLPRNFTGKVVFTPDSLSSIIGTAMSFISDVPLITGTSLYKDKLGTAIADSRLTLHAAPHSPLLPAGPDFTSDGYQTEDVTVIDKGVLSSYLLSLYGSRKTGLERAKNGGSNWIVDAGNQSFDEMIGSIDEGLLLCRFSGGNPSDNGDFSGVAKNSYYIRDGKIQFPVSETMVNGNIAAMLHAICGITSQRVMTGYTLFPWVCFDGIQVTGK